MEKELNVLIVEDLPSDAELAERQLRLVLENFTVQVVDTKDSFIQALEIFKPDLIVSDFMMPEFDGLTALNIKQDKYPFIPFVLLTGSVNEEVAVECMKAGADDYVIKEHIKRLGPAVLSAIDKKKNELERMHAEEALKESEEKFSKGFYENPTAMQIVDMNTGERLAVNSSMAKLLGYGIVDLLKGNIYKSEFWKDTEARSEAIDRLLNENFINDFHVDLMNKSGEAINIILSASILNIPNHRYGIVSYVDITEQKATEEKLKLVISELETLKNKIEEENIYFQEEIKWQHNFGEIVGKSKVMTQMFKQIELVSKTKSTVLILGETGTGKELVARAIHDLSDRKDRPLVKLNCSALPKELIESELFGHVKGAFTGAIDKRVGRFELANKGTIFLDEIGDLPLALQSRLLRVLQEGEFENVGSDITNKVDVRVIAATNRNLDQLVAEGEFRQDLYYRLNVFPIICPSLNERKEDIPLLVNHFIKKFNPQMGRKIESVPQGQIKKMQKYYWPGNVRELEHVIERSMVISQGYQLNIGDWFYSSSPVSEGVKIKTLSEHEKDYITDILEKSNWRIRGANCAADLLGMNPTTLESRMKKLQIKRQTS